MKAMILVLAFTALALTRQCLGVYGFGYIQVLKADFVQDVAETTLLYPDATESGIYHNSSRWLSRDSQALEFGKISPEDAIQTSPSIFGATVAMKATSSENFFFGNDNFTADCACRKAICECKFYSDSSVLDSSPVEASVHILAIGRPCKIVPRAPPIFIFVILINLVGFLFVSFLCVEIIPRGLVDYFGAARWNRNLDI